MRAIALQNEVTKFDFSLVFTFLLSLCFVITANIQLLIVVFPYVFMRQTKEKIVFLLPLILLYFISPVTLIQFGSFIIGYYWFTYFIRLCKGNVILANQFYLALFSFGISYINTQHIGVSLSFFVIQMVFYHETMKSFEWLKKQATIPSSIMALLIIGVVCLTFQYMQDYQQVFITLGIILLCFNCTPLISITSFFLLNLVTHTVPLDLFVYIYLLSLLKDQFWLMILVYLGLFVTQIQDFNQILILGLYLVFLLLLSKENKIVETEQIQHSNSKSFLHKQLVNFSLIFDHLGTYYESVSNVESSFLKSMSNALNYTSKKCIQNDKSTDFIKNQVISILEGYDIGYEGVKVEVEEDGFIRIECSLLHFGINEVNEVLLPLLNRILPTPIECASTQYSWLQLGVLNVEFISCPPIQIDAYADSVHTEEHCGDSFSIFQHSRNVYCVISDGMGRGYEASKISKCIIHLFQRMIFSNIHEIEAMACINKLLLSDAYATCDVLSFNRFQKSVIICKSAANPTYLIRNSELYAIWGNSLPIGIVAHIEVDHIHVQIEKGDFFVMSSDGVEVEEIVRWMKSSENLSTRKESERFINILKEKKRNDDSTILLAKVV